MSAPSKKPKKGNPSWPSAKSRSLQELDNDAFRALGLHPGRGRGALSWGGWGPDEARRQGQGELVLPPHPRQAIREEFEQAQRVVRPALVPGRKKLPRHAQSVDEISTEGDDRGGES